MLFRALTIVCAVVSAISLTACITGETAGSLGCTNPNATTLDGNPVPGNGDSCEHWSEAWCAQRTNARQIKSTVSYWAFNTNADYPPYETFTCDQLPRAMYMIGKKFDDHVLDYDWDDPFVRCNEPSCDRPCCSMRYVDPCKRKQPCYEPCDPCPVYYCEPCPQPCDPCPQPCDPCAPR